MLPLSALVQLSAPRGEFLLCQPHALALSKHMPLFAQNKPMNYECHILVQWGPFQRTSPEEEAEEPQKRPRVSLRDREFCLVDSSD